MIPKILQYVDKIDSTSSLWRGIGTNSELERQGLIETGIANWNENWSTIRKYHIAFFQRPVHKMCVDQVLLCKDLGLKIWVDLDDWIYLPKEHIMYEEYTKNFDELSFKKILYAADIITITNERMLLMYSVLFPQIEKKVTILSNSINDYVYEFKPISTNKRIVYRGGYTHEYDIKDYQESIKKVLIENPDWHFISIGQEFKKLKSLENYQALEKFEPHSYFGLICNLNPAIFIVPLKNNEFNMCKSNISWMEGTLSGAACLCPNYFTDTKALYYHSIQEFNTKFKLLLANDNLRKKLHKESVDEIRDNYLLSNVNKKRMQLINELL